MKPIKNVYICGLGAIGSAYASYLYKLSPACVRVIIDKSRMTRYQENKIVVNGECIPFSFIHPEEDAAPADLILIAVKQHHLAQAMIDIRKFVGEHTMILSLLNGIVSEEILAKEFGSEKVLYSFCVGTDAVRLENRITFSKIGKIVFGEKTNKALSPSVNAIKDLFDSAMIPYQIPEDMLRELWWKFMMNVGINQVSAILRAPYGTFQKVEAAQELMAMACREVIMLSSHEGVSLYDADIAEALRIIHTLSPEGKTSMFQDIEAGRKTELEIFAGTVIELGKKHGVKTPVNDILYKMIRSLEEMAQVF